jgi:type I restriction enzyme S subunit
MGALIFPKIGAAIATNKKRQLTRPSCVDNNVMAIIPNAERLDPDFLYFLFLTKNLSDFASDSNPPSIRKSEVERWTVRVPALIEQRRLVDILTRAESIVRLRREALKKTQEIIPALFLELFGDPATNPRGWSIVSIGELCEVKGGKRLPKGASYSDAPTVYRYIRGTDIVCDFIESSHLMFLYPDIQAGISRYVVKTGDVVITIAGKIGVAAPVGADLNGVNLTENAAMIRPIKGAPTHPLFLSRMLNSEYVQKQIEALTGRVTIGKLALERIKTIKVLLPAFELQSEFASRVEQIRAIQSQATRALATAEATFQSLLHRAFAGEL